MPDSVGRFFDTIAETRDPRAAVRAVAIDFDIPDGPRIVDPDTFRAIEVQRLFDTLNTCRTTIGQASLWASLCRPCDSLPAIEARQQALRELDAHDDLRARLESLVGWAEKGESILYHLLFGAFTGMLGTAAGKLEFDGYGYSQYRHGTRFLLEISAMARDLPRPESAYLNELIDALTGFVETRASALMREPVYLTERGIRLSGERPKWWPAFRFRPSLFKPGLLVAFALCVVLLSQLNPFPAGLPVSPLAGISFVLLLPVALLYVPAVGGFDRDQFVYPLRDRFRAADEVRRVLAALGRIDELLALHRYARSFGSATVLPRVVDSQRHFLTLRGARNPVLGFGNHDYVPNHIDLETTRLTFITGPNSGGKTALCKTIAQVQLLAQIGGCPGVGSRGGDLGSHLLPDPGGGIAHRRRGPFRDRAGAHQVDLPRRLAQVARDPGRDGGGDDLRGEARDLRGHPVGLRPHRQQHDPHHAQSRAGRALSPPAICGLPAGGVRR